MTGAGSVLVSFFYNARGEHEKAEGGGGGGLGHLPFTWKNRKFLVDNQVVRAIPFSASYEYMSCDLRRCDSCTLFDLFN